MVVTSTTPFAALAPYIADDAASLRTLTDSISSGLSIFKSPGTLSISTRGEPPLIESVPRMLIDFPACPGDDPPVIVSPGMEPCRAA